MTGAEIVALIKLGDELMPIAIETVTKLQEIFSKLSTDVTVADIIKLQAEDDQAKFEEESALEKARIKEAADQVKQ